MRESADKLVHQAQGTGRWLPADARQLRADIFEYLDKADVPAANGAILAGIAPHAGYVYSGPIAGYTFRAVQAAIAAGQTVETVVVLGLSHQAAFSGVILLDGDAIRTPLGETPLDVAGTQMLAAGSDRIRVAYGPHAGEHSAENEIPFVQVAAPGAALIVGLLGDHTDATVDALVEGLVKLGRDRKLLVIASSDLLHDPDYVAVTARDQATLALIKTLDARGLAEDWNPRRQVCCGIGPVLTVLRYAARLGCTAGEVLRYRNSGDDHPESRGNWVVGYGAVVFRTSAAQVPGNSD